MESSSHVQPKVYDFALIIPCYNEERGIKSTLEVLHNFFLEDKYWQGRSVALVVVDDGSNDATGSIIEEYCRQENGVLAMYAVRQKVNGGKGSAIQAGVAAVTSRAYGFMDADLSFSPELLLPMLEKLKGADLVIGEREDAKHASLYARMRGFISHGLSALVRRLTGITLGDTQCGIKVFSEIIAHEVVPSVKQSRFSFDVELLVRAYRGGFCIETYPVTFIHRKGSIGALDGIRYLLDVVAVADSLGDAPKKSFFLGLTGIGAVLAMTMFGWTLQRGFFFSDDFTWLWHGKKIGMDIVSMLTFRMSTFYSPVLNTFYAFAYPLFGVNSVFYFLFGILIHAGVASGMALLLWQLTRSRIAAIVAMALTIVVGGAYEPLVWIGANMHSIVALFIVWSLVSYQGFLETKRGYYALITLLLALLAFGTKEIAVVVPLLLLGLLLLHLQKAGLKNAISPLHGVLVGSVFMLECAYLYLQYVWQHQSVWVTQGIWQVNAVALGKMPLAALDIFLPLGPILNNQSAPFILVVALVLLGYLMVRYRTMPVVMWGLAWLFLAMLPTIFFQTPHWWEPLASRYTYLPRLGMVVVFSAIIAHHVLNNRARRVINVFVWVLILSVCVQVAVMAHVVRTAYGYVYQTGRAFVEASTMLREINPTRVLVDWNRPFTDNHAHIVGLLDIQAQIPESRVVFLERGQNITPLEGDVVLLWQVASRSYRIEVTKKP